MFCELVKEAGCCLQGLWNGEVYFLCKNLDCDESICFSKLISEVNSKLYKLLNIHVCVYMGISISRW